MSTSCCISSSEGRWCVSSTSWSSHLACIMLIRFWPQVLSYLQSRCESTANSRYIGPNLQVLRWVGSGANTWNGCVSRTQARFGTRGCSMCRYRYIPSDSLSRIPCTCTVQVHTTLRALAYETIYPFWKEVKSLPMTPPSSKYDEWSWLCARSIAKLHRSIRMLYIKA